MSVPPFSRTEVKPGPAANQVECSCGETVPFDAGLLYCRRCEAPRCAWCWAEALEVLYCPGCMCRLWDTMATEDGQLEASICPTCRMCPSCANILPENQGTKESMDSPGEWCCDACGWSSSKPGASGGLDLEVLTSASNPKANVPGLDPLLFTQLVGEDTTPRLEQLLLQPSSCNGGGAGLFSQPARVRLQSKTTIRCGKCDQLLYQPDGNPRVDKPRYLCLATEKWKMHTS